MVEPVVMNRSDGYFLEPCGHFFETVLAVKGGQGAATMRLTTVSESPRCPGCHAEYEHLAAEIQHQAREWGFSAVSVCPP